MLLEHPDITKMENYGALDNEEPVCYCCNCDYEIYEGEDYYDIDENIYCETCILEFKKHA